MAQATILAEAATAGTSTDVVIAAASQINLGIFATPALPALAEAWVLMDTPGGDVEVARLDRKMPAVAVFGPGTFRVFRPANPNVAAFGVFSET